MLICGRGLKADEKWLSAETSWVHDVARGQRDMAGGGSSITSILLLAAVIIITNNSNSKNSTQRD